eukprot:4060556-Prymnesium_polylepis.1
MRTACEPSPSRAPPNLQLECARPDGGRGRPAAPNRLTAVVSGARAGEGLAPCRRLGHHRRHG